MSIEKIAYVWPEWKVVGQLGEGSYGRVFRVMRNEHGVTSNAAVKVISIPQSEAELASMRAEGLDEMGTKTYFRGIVSDFINEIKLMESMKGTSNIVSIEDFKVLERRDRIGWDILIRMELLMPLNNYIATKDMSEADIIKLGQHVCTALEICAQRNIIHRDIKPENIFVSQFGDFKVGDFGIAREREKTSGSLSQKGTYNYMAPEVRMSKHYGPSVDTYSLGLVLYKLLNNNRLPFLNPIGEVHYQDRVDAINRRFSGEPVPKPFNASTRMAQVILTACSFEPVKRFNSPTAFKNALGTVLRETRVAPGAVSPIYNQSGGMPPNSAATPGGMPPNNVNMPIGGHRPTPFDFDVTHGARTPHPPQNPGYPPQPHPPRPYAQHPAPFGQHPPQHQAPHPPHPYPQHPSGPNIPTDSFGKKKKSGGKKFVIILIILLFLGGGAFGLYYFNPGGILDGIFRNPVAAVINALEDGNFEEAVALAADADNEALRPYLEENLAALEADFVADEIDFISASRHLDAIADMNIPGISWTLSETRNMIYNLNESRWAYNSANEAFNNGEFLSAIIGYSLVISGDPNWASAQFGLAMAVEAYNNEILAISRGYSDNGYYEQALLVLMEAMEIVLASGLETNTILVEETINIERLRTNAYLQEQAQQRDHILHEAAEAANANNWVLAIDMLRFELAVTPDDVEIASILLNYEQSYVAYAITQSNTMVATGSYNDAISFLNIVLQTLPGNLLIIEEISRIEDIRPVNLATLVVIDSREYVYNEDIFTDSFGNNHSESFQFRPQSNGSGGQLEYSFSGDTAYAVFNLNGEFSTFSAEIVVPTGTDSYAEFMIEIIFGENVVPVTYIEGYTVRTGIRRIEVNVTDVTTMTIIARVRDSSSSSHRHYIHLVNTELAR